MCLLVFSINDHPNYNFIFAGNRDEFYGRPTRGAQFWEDHPHLLAGKDLKKGGAWLGITEKGKFSVITNFRDPALVKKDPPSRGKLVLDYLVSGIEPGIFLQEIDRKAEHYDGFNLLAGTTGKIMYYSNKQQEITEVPPGIHGLSNHLLNTPWPKVVKAKRRLGEIIDSDHPDTDALFEMLTDPDPAPDRQLPDTGIPPEWEKAVSSIFIDTEKYGTRCSTVILVDKQGSVSFLERRYKPGTTDILESNEYNFQIKQK